MYKAGNVPSLLLPHSHPSVCQIQVFESWVSVAYVASPHILSVYSLLAPSSPQYHHLIETSLHIVGPVKRIRLFSDLHVLYTKRSRIKRKVFPSYSVAHLCIIDTNTYSSKT